MNTTNLCLFLVFGIVLCTSVKGQTNWQCSGKAEGTVIELGCWGLRKCDAGGNVIDVYCPNGEVLRRDDLECVAPGNGTACGLNDVCVGTPDGSYPDVSYGCSSFYICQSNSFLGRIICPSTLVYNPAKGVCDYPVDVYSPCGSKVV